MKQVVCRKYCGNYDIDPEELEEKNVEILKQKNVVEKTSKKFRQRPP